MKKFYCLLIQIIIFFSYFFLTKLVNASSIELISTEDAMVRENMPNYNYGSWSAIAIGKSWNLESYFSDSIGLIKFDVAMLSNKIIKSAQLEISQYVRSDNAIGNYTLDLYANDQNWSEFDVNWNNKPIALSKYSQTVVDGFASQFFSPPKKFYLDITHLVADWSSGAKQNFGISLKMGSGNAGGFWCSRNYNNSTCFDYSRPKLIVSYEENVAPEIPSLVLPENLAVFGGNSSGNGFEVSLVAQNIGDLNGNLDGSFFYFKKENDANWQVSEKITESGKLTFKKSFSDGKWIWKVVSVDKYGALANSVERKFLVDTTSPTAVAVINEPEFSSGLSNEIFATLSYDNLSEVYYKFFLFDENVLELLNESQWVVQNHFIFSNLINDISYCYKVKAKDAIGNETVLSKEICSRQDAESPKIIANQISSDVISPNGDGFFDKTIILFDVDEKNFFKFNVKIVDLNENQIFFREFFEKKFSFTWYGDCLDNSIALDGIYKIKISVFDFAQNFGNVEFTVTIDKTAPYLNISSPKDKSWLNQTSVVIKGQTESNSIISSNFQSCLIDENGIFECSLEILKGKNEIDVVSCDFQKNCTSSKLVVFVDLDYPILKYYSPNGKINNSKPIILLSFSDLKSEYYSGIDNQSLNLQLKFENDESFFLYNNGLNTKPDFGKLSSINSGDDVNFSYEFFNNLPDGNYSVISSISDNAQNNLIETSFNFEIDSKIYIEMLSPVNNFKYTRKSFPIMGKAEKNSVIRMTINSNEIFFLVNEQNQFISNCDDELHESGIKINYCKFSINDEIFNYSNRNELSLNTLIIDATDAAGNLKHIEITFFINLFDVEFNVKLQSSYISPNGDGKFDEIQFIIDFKENFSGEQVDYVKQWEIEIFDEFGFQVAGNKFFSQIPFSINFEARNFLGEFLQNGLYKAIIKAETFDEILINSNDVEFFVKNELQNQIFIAFPTDKYLTARGVINIQGQAEKNCKITICRIVPLNEDCVETVQTQSNENGFFSGISTLSVGSNLFFAYAIDKFGNQSEVSNKVQVIHDFSDPIMGAFVIPELIAKNKEVLLRSVVSKYTEFVDVSFSTYNNVQELSEYSNSLFIQRIDGNLLDEKLDSCLFEQCIWDFYWQVPSLNGGIYEIIFSAKKAEIIKTFSVGLRVDSLSPSVPQILSITKTSNSQTARNLYGKFWINECSFYLNGFGEPSSTVLININEVQTESAIVSNLGKWNVQINYNCKSQFEEIKITVKSIDVVGNESQKTVPIALVIDLNPPQFVELKPSADFINTSKFLQVYSKSDELLYFAKVIRKDKTEFEMVNYNNTYFSTILFEPYLLDGSYELEVVFEDIAGNKNAKNLIVFIDNSKPNPTQILLDEWGKYSGYYSKKGIPSKNRFIDCFVFNEKVLPISGFAEKNAFVEIFIDGNFFYSVKVDTENCLNNEICSWHAFIEFGLEKGYQINLRVRDLAENVSNFSSTITIYFDQTPPQKPEIEKLVGFSNRYNLMYQTNKNQVELLINVEHRSDLQINISKNGETISNEIINEVLLSSYLKKLPFYNGEKDDGIYDFSLRSFDSSGNKSETLFFKFERDSKAPKIREIKVFDETEMQKFLVNVVIENYAVLQTIVKRKNGASREFLHETLNQSDINFEIFDDYFFNSQYEFIFVAIDRAGNISNAEIINLKTSAPIGYEEFNQRKSNIEIQRSSIRLFLNRKDCNFEIKSKEIVSPTLTYASNIDEIVSVYGFGPKRKNIIDSTIDQTMLSYSEAVLKCKVGLSISEKEKICIEENMGITNLSDWLFEKQKRCLFSIPIYTQACILNAMISEKIEKSDKIGINAEKVLIDLYLYSNDSKLIATLENNSDDNQFKFRGLNLKSYDFVRSKSVILTNLEFGGCKIDLSRKNEKNASLNLESYFGNAIIIPDVLYKYDNPVGFPFRNFKIDKSYENYFSTIGARKICSVYSCNGSAIRGTVSISRGANETGHGKADMDFGFYKVNNDYPFLIVSTVDGLFKRDDDGYNYKKPQFIDGRWRCPNDSNALTSEVISPTGKIAVFAHLNPSTTNLMLWKNKEKNVIRGDAVGLSGSTGCSTGIHLHYGVIGYDTAAFYNSFFDEKSLSHSIESSNYIFNKELIEKYIYNFLNNFQFAEINF